MNKIELVWFYSLYIQKLLFWAKMLSFYIKKIFLTIHHVTLENIFRILNNLVYFQNVVVCNEPLNGKM